MTELCVIFIIKEKEKREKLLAKIAPGLGNKYHKKEAMKELEKQSKSGKSVSVIKEVSREEFHLFKI